MYHGTDYFTDDRDPSDEFDTERAYDGTDDPLFDPDDDPRDTVERALAAARPVSERGLRLSGVYHDYDWDAIDYTHDPGYEYDDWTHPEPDCS